ncbi:hypothetical protein KAR91_77245, partial [Candidatus Pacearchaeota archaeon]|nr:hypothetical protein [Candidatus Pacearchaeota archaeon]
MKKILLSAAAFGLVFGVASTASAAFDSFSVTGYYEVKGTYQSDGLGRTAGVDLVENAAGANNEEPGADSFYQHDFRMYPVLKVNDKISMFGDIRLASTGVWGTGTNFYDSGNQGVTANKIYMEYEAPVGKVRIGRTPGGAWGGDFLNSGSSRNRIIYWPSFIPKPFGIMVLTEKNAENDSISDTTVPLDMSDRDTDNYLFEVSHTADFGVSKLAYYHSRMANQATTVATQTQSPLDGQHIWYHGKYTVANFDIEGEVQWQFGDSSYSGFTVVEEDSLGAMLDVTGTFGNLSVGTLMFYASGQDRTATATADNEALMGGNGVGDDFQPYAILTGSWTGILNSDNATAGTLATLNGPNATTYNLAAAGVKSIGLHATFDVTPELQIGGAIGAAWCDEEQLLNQDDDYGVEYDLTAAYKLMDNLTYSVTL